MSASSRRAMAFALTLGLSGAAPTLAAAAQVRQVYAPLWFVDNVALGPCLLTLAGPASAEEACIPWTRREVASPALHRATGTLLVGGLDGKLHARDVVDGRSLYAVPMPGRVFAKPVFIDDSAYFGTADAVVVRADVTSGRIRWQQSVDAEVLEPATVAGALVIVVTGLDTVYAFDRESGASRWVYKHPLPGGITLRGQARPQVAEVQTPQGPSTRVYVGHASGSMSVLDLQTGRLIDRWSLGKDVAFVDVDSDPVVRDGRVVAASQAVGVFSLDAVTGKTLWKLDESGITRLAAGGDALVVAAGPGKVLGLEAATGKVRWRFTFSRGAPGRPAVQGGRVHIASDRGALYVLDLQSGEPLQYFGTGNGFAADLELDADLLLAMSTAGRLFALSNAFEGRFQPK
ncbi:MAG: PQQ-binding-like beta-propeller repeat protein [Myxococcota bacterium]